MKHVYVCARARPYLRTRACVYVRERVMARTFCVAVLSPDVPLGLLL